MLWQLTTHAWTYNGNWVLLQVISGELNRVVVELLQQLLFWQERQKAQDPLKAAKKKRLVSGLRLGLHFCHYASHPASGADRLWNQDASAHDALCRSAVF